MKEIIHFIVLFSISTLVLAKNEVETTHGRVAGTQFKTFLEEKKYQAFMGIPFATPPVKDLRFKSPQSMKPWEGVLKATKIKPACIQYNYNVLKSQYGEYGVEDCLYLDIFTPAVDENKRPVVIFLYNERLQNSYNKTKDYSPDFFIEEDLVVVTISHRLTVFGFLSLEDDTVPGNAGLKDIVMALEWISNNIDKFGGDPSKITLLGAQGGAVAVDLLIRSKAKKFFHSAIIQSGSSLNPMYLQEKVRDRAFELGKLLEISTSSTHRLLEELNSVSPSKLFELEYRAAPDDYFKDNQKGILTFGPIVEKHANGLITEYPEDSFENINIPVMIGFNSREGLAASHLYLETPNYLTYVEKDFPLLMPLRLKFRFDPFASSYYNAAKDIKNFYFKKGKVTIKSTPEYVTYIGDVVAYSLDKTAKMYANLSSKPVYYYHFDYYGDFNENKDLLLKKAVVEDGTWGATIGDELCYLFRCPNLNDKYAKLKSLEADKIGTQKKIVKMWANFVKYGNPTPENDSLLNDIKWPSYNLETKEYLLIGKNFQVKTNLWQERFKFWDNFIKKWEKRAHNGVVTDDKSKRDEL
ncbi:unnamed protein product [Euphydryas editha]|uniref:Carboxylesterase type B domain-containing protein n=1 Tax=Euphydryas editha TaxID=104508 RepID=A0AAU9TQU3_EUPED|nr:unnamed protein product [Euphydryas editha]